MYQTPIRASISLFRAARSRSCSIRRKAPTRWCAGIDSRCHTHQLGRADIPAAAETMRRETAAVMSTSRNSTNGGGKLRNAESSAPGSCAGIRFAWVRPIRRPRTGFRSRWRCAGPAGAPRRKCTTSRSSASFPSCAASRATVCLSVIPATPFARGAASNNNSIF